MQRLMRRAETGRGRGGVASHQGVGIFQPTVFDFLPDDGDVEGGAADRVQCDTGAGLAATLEHTGIGEGAQGAVHGGAGAAEFGGQINLIGDHLTGLPFAGVDAAQNLVLDGLPVFEQGLGHRASRRGFMVRV